MELKKNEDQRVERHMTLFYLIGLNAALLLSIAAFEWKTYDRHMIPWEQTGSIFEPLVDPPSTIHQVIPPKLNQFQIEEVKVDPSETAVEIIEEILKDPTTEVSTIPEYLLVDEPADEHIHLYVDKSPEFPGGWNEFYRFIGANIKYPSAAKNMRMEGKVFIEFVIEKDGSISDLKVIKGLGGGLSDESLRVMKLLPNFTPGKLNGKEVRVKMVLPISFQLK